MFALRALANSSDAEARNWAAEFKRGKHEPPAEKSRGRRKARSRSAWPK